MTTITLDLPDAVELAETLEYLHERICYPTTTIENPLLQPAGLQDIEDLRSDINRLIHRLRQSKKAP
jgi:hypothetical protein